MPLPHLLLKTFVMPEDLNPLGTAFGGHIMGELDKAGASLARRTAKLPIMLVGVTDLCFKAPFLPADELIVYGDVARVGNTSITIRLEAHAVNPLTQRDMVAATALYTYVAIDLKTHQPQPIAKA